jgi:hypothetical protein
MRERSRGHIVRRAGALALVWVLIAVASWAIASGGRHSGARTRTLATSAPAALRLPSLNAGVPPLRGDRRRAVHVTRRRASHGSRGHSSSGGSSPSPGTGTAQVVTQTDSPQTSPAPASAGSSSSGSSSSSSGSSGSNGDVPPTGGPPPP